jgi:hypothetical protein
MEEWKYSSTILDFGIRWRWVVASRPWGKSPRYPLDRRLGGPQSRPVRCGAENNLLPLKGSSGPLCWLMLLTLHRPPFTYDSWFHGGFLLLTSILPLGIGHRFYVGCVADFRRYRLSPAPGDNSSHIHKVQRPKNRVHNKLLAIYYRLVTHNNKKRKTPWP